MTSGTVLVIGAGGQIGTVLVRRLQEKYGKDRIIASDLRPQESFEGNFEILDATDAKALEAIILKYNVKEIYHLAAILSAKGEEDPLWTWNMNMNTLFNVLEAGRVYQLDKIFYPSSIAVFGNKAAPQLTSQNTFLNPTTVYGISKASGENWAQYYFERYGLDVRSVRYPGIIGYQSLPGGGTTDYAVDIYHKAVLGESFDCFLEADTILPMMYMEDAINATIAIMEAPKEAIKERTSYNLAAMSFSPAEIADSIRRIYPNFSITYTPDHRQQIAESWPQSIDDTAAKEDWGWKPAFDLDAMTDVMIQELKKQYQTLQLI